MYWQRQTKIQIDGQNEVKQVPSFYMLFSTMYTPILFWYQIKLLNKIWRTRNADVSMSVKWQSNFCCFWKLFLKIQMNSKFDETWFIVSTMKGTSTHLKESNWATTWFWKIKIHKHCQLVVVHRELRIFFWEPKTAADSIFKPQFDLVSSWSGPCSKNKVCSTPLKLQLLFKLQLHASTISGKLGWLALSQN